MTASFGALPALLAEIAEVAGIDAAIAIAKAKGGAKAHFPARAGDEHWLTKSVGRTAADKLCKHFGGERGGILLLVPLGPQNFYAQARRRALELRKDHSIMQTARALGVTTRAVEMWTAKSKQDKDDGQGRLF